MLLVALAAVLWLGYATFSPSLYDPDAQPRPVTATLVASVAVLVGMWLERWNIIIPTMTHPYLVAYAEYHPTLTEIALTAGSLALFVLLFLVFFKLFPVVSIWEVAEGRVIDEARAKVAIPLPKPTEPARHRQRWARR